MSSNKKMLQEKMFIELGKQMNAEMEDMRYAKMEREKAEMDSLKENINNTVCNKMCTLVDCLWVSSKEFQSLTYAEKNYQGFYDARCKTAVRLMSIVKKSAIMLKNVYECDKEQHSDRYMKYYLREINRYIDNPREMYGARLSEALAC